MITNFFKKVNNENAAPSEDEPAPKKAKKEHKKRNLENGFCPKITKERVERMALSKESGKWRNFEEITVNYTLISKGWSYDDGNNFRELVLVPYGIQETIIRLFSSSRNAVWNTIREEVKVILF